MIGGLLILLVIVTTTTISPLCGADSVANNVQTFDKLNDLIDNICVPKKFQDPLLCDGPTIVETFRNVSFNFKSNEDVRTYGAWLRLLNNLEFFKRDRGDEIIESIADKNLEWIVVNTNINSKMRSSAAEVFRWTSDTWVKFHVKNDYARFEDTLPSFVNFFNTIPLWSSQDFAYFFKVTMYAYLHVRQTYSLHTFRIDRVVRETVQMILEYPLTIASVSEIKKLFYIYYVCDLDANEQLYFKEYYTIIAKNNIMPYTNSFLVDNKFNFTIHHNVGGGKNNDTAKIEAMREETDYVYNTVSNFFQKTNISIQKPSSSVVNVAVYVHDNKQLYEMMGPMWSISTDNGGYTHVYRGKIESHVYYEKKLLPRNYGHELVHAIMFAEKVIRQSPLWFAEGVANRLGNRLCYSDDHDNMKRFLATSAAEIVDAKYGNPILYGMGSALTAFFIETRPLELGRMIMNHNFTFDVKDKVLEQEFSEFKTNKIIECDLTVQQEQIKNKKKFGPGVQELYKQSISSIDFGLCKNFVKFTFNDVIFYMTPDRLIKTTNDNPSIPINDQREIKHNTNNAISLFDYNWFLKGALRQTLYSFGDTRHILKIDDTYSYASTATCQHPDADPYIVINNFTYASGVWDSVSYMAHKSYSEGEEFVRNYARNAKLCDIFINPPVADKSIPRRLTNLASRMDKLKHIQLSVTDERVRVDVRGNTLLHLMALQNPRLFASYTAGRNFTDSINLLNFVNYDGMSAINLYEYSRAYMQTLKKPHNKYCWSALPGSLSNVYRPSKNVYSSTMKSNILPSSTIISTSTTTSPEILQTTLPTINVENVTKKPSVMVTNRASTQFIYAHIKKNPSTHAPVSYSSGGGINQESTTVLPPINKVFYNTSRNEGIVNQRHIVVFIILLIAIVLVVILVNVLITCIIIKLKLIKHEKKQKDNKYVSFNKTKFYDQDESVNLFD
ncbi:orf116 [Sucra jujuba nucleopolyhedrovirus]|uniref:Orf116 n=1 Tax=Sucra jujuba nucleopolyhedrovirus TaxID=1563660 RepID=A0A097P945_9ABAC|nr:orf116 [Sucra jujuba nucleopolyhedrovirus]AIU41355.1 orf116 [Sucra jujuba nucleopolyhedrovirus]